ncbi:MAG: undecaprenyl-phosphate alpha-N-acetylglucosaminyl 1-phosphate transferase [Chloroflexota bacterium]|nr:undecaprenyl/decaprenyl-phosphate alpha-N-acetylglucosaminyl 1-phosphate transferase [Caldilinea sp.]GIK74262.1 MAG: undecaprenyl-phosphate alpha-N-acetylglucosaminyl 1-phosphate transferase [Chloroflexota bacterium]
MIFLTTLAFAFLLTLLLTPLAGSLGRRWGLVDAPGGRRKHTGIVPRTGGLALFGGFFVTVLLLTFLPDWLPAAAAWFPTRNDPNEERRLAALLIGSVYCVVFGLLDDRFSFKSGPQYLIQFGAAVIGFAGLIFIKHVNNPFAEGFFFGPDGFPWWIVFPLTVFWFMGMMNTINFLDGASGLVAGVTAVLSTVLALHMIFKAEPPQLSVALLPTALLGVTLGFLPFNFGRRIFMGSSGSYFLGFVVAALGIIGGARLATVMMVVGLPALEVGWLMFTRWRRGVSPGEGGRDHLHFRLLDMGVDERVLVVGYWIFCAVLGAFTLLIDDRLLKFAALSVGVVAGIAIFVWASRQPAKSTA